MSCVEIEVKLDLLMDGELLANDGDAIFQHLAVCRECQSYLSRYSQIRNTIREERIAIPVSLDERVLGHAEVAGRNERSVWRSRVNIPLPVAAAAVICLAALTAFALLSEREPDPQQAVTGNLVDAGRTEYLYLLPAVQVVGNDQVEPSSESIQQ